MRGDVFDVSAGAADARPLRSVEFLIDGISKATVTAAPFTYRWQSPNMEGTNLGEHLLLVRATDAAGNAATATQTLRLLSRTCNVQVGATIVRQGQSLASRACAATGRTSARSSSTSTACCKARRSRRRTSGRWIPAPSRSAVTSSPSGIPAGPEQRVEPLRRRRHHRSGGLATRCPDAPALGRRESGRGRHRDGRRGRTDERCNRSASTLDGALKATVAAAPFQYAWATAPENFGYHTLLARATDAGGSVLSGTANLYVLSRACNVFVSTRNTFASDTALVVSANAVAQGTER